MDELTHLIQKGGGEAMNIINNQSGGAVQMIFQVILIATPIIFFLVYYFWHLGLDDERAETEKDDEGREYKQYVLWGKFSIKVILMMIGLCFFFKDIIGWIITTEVAKKIINPGGNLTGYYWSFMFYLIIISGIITIIFGGLKSTAYQYFVDDLYDDREKMKEVCVEFGCGYAPDGDAPVTRGDKV